MTEAPSAYRITQAMATWQSTRARLLEDDADLAHDEAALTRMLGPAEGDVRDILARLLRAAQHATGMAEGAAEQMATLRGRQDRYKRRAEQFRATAFAMMDAMGERRVELPDITASIRAGTVAVVVTDEGALPEEYIRIRREPDKAAILADLKQGVVIDGAVLSNPAPNLQLRST